MIIETIHGHGDQGRGDQDDGDQAPLTLGSFDQRSGSLPENLVFNYRGTLILICLVLTAIFGWHASRLTVVASFDKMIPGSHSFILNYKANIASLRSLGNAISVVVENKRGDIYDPDYLELLRKVNDTLFLMPGVDRSFMKSIWTPAVRWTENTEQGFSGGPVMPGSFDGSPDKMAELRANVARAGLVGSLVANDQRSSMVFVPLLDLDPRTGQALDYGAFSDALEAKVRALQTPATQIYIVGFAKLVGDLIAGLWEVLGYFGVSALIATSLLFRFTRCLRSTAVIVMCSLIAVTWQLGIVNLLGYPLDPYSILVPFLIFAIGVSHGAQKMNGIMLDIGRGTDRYIAARLTFRRLFVAGCSALIADTAGFAVLMVIDIPVIQELALSASVGVSVLIFTNLALLPVCLSYVGVGRKAAARALRHDPVSNDGRRDSLAVRFLVALTERRNAVAVLVGTVALAAAGMLVGRDLKIGDLNPGAPELRAHARYNLDNAYITGHYGLSNDQLAVIVKSEQPFGIAKFATLVEMDRLEQELLLIPGVQTTISVAGPLRRFTAGGFEGNPKWMTINRDHFVTDIAVNGVRAARPELANTQYTVAPVIVYLKDHKAETLTQVVQAVEKFAGAHDTAELRFMLAAGNAGIEAATNIVVAKANGVMLFLVYGAVVVLCLISFRSWRATVVAVIPLMLTSILCEALMVALGIGVKVATLPVIALGVGIGVDYALYLLTIQLACLRSGLSLRKSYRIAVQTTGTIVGLVAVTLAGGVAVWAASPIKFQADMGELLAFMFLWNMVGALALTPALSHLLLQPSAVPAAGNDGRSVPGVRSTERSHPSSDGKY